ncbi:Ppx/GppA phosphatase family protein [Marinigracilibium pacificum]|uniref:Phosphatase n=1 Tax=Marinigracilibium pacificum TaxID=2729599 RepID=A0A848J0P1_9BACT|nr:phosphatase [Marinigracilibium pacificum]NMM49231.1 phosphatase [Marinigracilibium pacificum]
MKLAVVDIGSNAIRFQVNTAQVFREEVYSKKLEYVRFPLRLGKDVFKYGRIKKKRVEKFIELMNVYKSLMDLYEVDDYLICATSAMREADNGPEIATKVKESCGLKIRIIDGDEEASMINNALKQYLNENIVIHVDVGGGSTELNIYRNRKKLIAHSFKLGSVRSLGHFESPKVWEKIHQWIGDQLEKYNKKGLPVSAIGTGGNISKIMDLSENGSKGEVTIDQIKEVKSRLSEMSYEERVYLLNLNEDRADVILPAADIYLAAMEWAGADTMIVPTVGLKDGMIQKLIDRHFDQKPALKV